MDSLETEASNDNLLGSVLTSHLCLTCFSSLLFHGCFQVDKPNMFFTSLDNLNNNLNCMDVCLSYHYPLFATSGKTCLCLDLFPEKKLALASEGDKARGESSRCNQKCPADAGEICEEESCCGGPENAFTVYSTGSEYETVKK